MKNNVIFDKIVHEVGDVVIQKFKEDGATKEVVSKSIMVENLDNFSYSILFFESSPNSPRAGFEYEPYNKKDRDEYYKIWSELEKPVSKRKIKTKSVSKVVKLKL